MNCAASAKSHYSSPKSKDSNAPFAGYEPCNNSNVPATHPNRNTSHHSMDVLDDDHDAMMENSQIHLASARQLDPMVQVKKK